MVDPGQQLQPSLFQQICWRWSKSSWWSPAQVKFFWRDFYGKKIFQTFHKILILCCYQASAQTAASGTDSRLLHVESWNHWTSNLTQYAHPRWREITRDDQTTVREHSERHTSGGDRSTARESTSGGDKKHSQREQTAVRRAQPRKHESEVRATRVRAIRKRNNEIDKYNNYLSSWINERIKMWAFAKTKKCVDLDDASKQPKQKQKK